MFLFFRMVSNNPWKAYHSLMLWCLILLQVVNKTQNNQKPQVVKTEPPNFSYRRLLQPRRVVILCSRFFWILCFSGLFSSVVLDFSRLRENLDSADYLFSIVLNFFFHLFLVCSFDLLSVYKSHPPLPADLSVAWRISFLFSVSFLFSYLCITPFCCHECMSLVPIFLRTFVTNTLEK